MIIFEEKFRDLVDLLPPHINTVTANELNIKYGWGTQDELNKYLALPRAESPYPLIWLLIEKDKEDLASQIIRRKTKLLIATVSDKQSEMNPFIYQTDYKDILIPIVENLFKVIYQSGISRLINDEIEREFLPNYSVRDNKGQVDVWNAIYLEFELELWQGSCIQEIFFN